MIRGGVKTAKIKLDIIISIHNKILMIIHYGPGSITTRHRPALAISRTVSDYKVPVIVVSNGENADILFYIKNDNAKKGFESIPSKESLLKLTSDYSFKKISKKQVEMVERILYAFEMDGCCCLLD